MLTPYVGVVSWARLMPGTTTRRTTNDLVKSEKSKADHGEENDDATAAALDKKN